MFKKGIKIGGQNQLSGKDKKGMKAKMGALFGGDAVEAIFGRFDKITCSKVSGGKMLIYTSEAYPLFVDGTGKGDYFPTIYSACAFEPLTRCLILNEGV